ncbi:MAG: DUF455 family protein [Calditrichaeota bacterium]|nr:DUF455 family protein [Calditrichota bacterium]
MTSYRDFARQLLFSDTITDKLIFPDDLNDIDLSETESPKFPARPQQMSITRHNSNRFPSVHQLDKDSNAAIVMHYFANHELLAIELMALVLLKFPKADPKFRRDIVRTIREEQQHMSLYLERMSDFNLRFGEIPASDMFWRSISTMKDPMDFVCRMSLTFEQANLDFCLFYKQHFETIDDRKTAAILDRVYRDEIGHVKSGYHWFKQWKNPTSNDWQSYLDHLDFPLTPQRAKGNFFDLESRKKAGLDDTFIDKIRLFSHSKGRTPDVYYFNPSAELEILSGDLTSQQSTLARDLETLLIFIAKKDDIVLLNELPDENYLKSLIDLGIQLPQLLRISDLSTLKDRKLNRFVPWGHSPISDRIDQRLLKQTTNRFRLDQRYHWNTDLIQFYNKTNHPKILRELLKQSKHTAFKDSFISENFIPEVCSDLDELLKSINAIKDSHSHCVVKGRYGAAANQSMKIRSAPIDQHTEDRLENFLNKQGNLIVSPWFNNELDFSLQFIINSEGKIKPLGPTHFLTSDSGAYRGHYLQHFDANLSTEQREFLRKQQKGSSLLDMFQNLLIDYFTETELSRYYIGPFSVDAMLLRENQELKLYPFLEINPRFNMGYLSLQLKQRLSRLNPKRFDIFTIQQIKRLGFNSINQFLSSNNQLICLTELNKATQFIACITI